MAKKFRKFKSLLTEDGYRRIKEVRDNILRVKLPAIREEIACEVDKEVISYLEKEKMNLLRYVLRQNQLLHFSHVIPSHDKPKEHTIRKEVQWFSEQMEAKLKENDHKGGWGNCGIFWLRNRLIEEVNELSAAMDAGHNSESGLDLKNIIREAADVANFAMMIADKARERLA